MAILAGCLGLRISEILGLQWAQPIDAEHRIFNASSDVKDAEGHVLVTAYAVLRPDGQWSLMLINSGRSC